MKKNVIRSKGLTRYQEQMLLLFTPALMRTVFEQIWIGAKKGDIAFVKLAAQAVGLVEEKSGVNIITNIQQNQIAAGSGSGFQFDRVVRQLALQERTMDALPAPEDDRADH